MSTIVSLSSNLHTPFSTSLVSLPRPRLSLPGFIRCRLEGRSPSGSDGDSPERENALLKVAWNASELLGIAASFFTSRDGGISPAVGDRDLAGDDSVTVDRAVIVQAIKDDFQRSYFVNGFVL